MKTGLVSAIVVAVLLLGYLFYWKTRQPEGDAPESHFQAAAVAPEPSVVLSNEAAGPEETARSTAAPAPVAPPALDSDLASPSEKPSDKTLPEVATPMPPTDSDPNQAFAVKYAGMSTEARREALDSLQVFLDRQHLSEEQIIEFKREIEWLSQNDSP